ncbi:DUF892 family protein [Paraburkholderia silviterrae]|uniref:DUF892 family protein n=1 Tax=Paraburkholderia silviterrae TaxID=2528715 RepID=UPI00196A5A98|nr:DUF892 family protein [Paraburkholderia silviterrae]
MNTQREELLCLLRDAYMCGQGAAQLLAEFLEHHPDSAQISAVIEAFLAKTLEHQRLLAECLARIEEKTEVPQPKTNDVSRVPSPEERSTGDVPRDLTHLRARMLQEITLYSSVIATAEASGLFETRFVCEGVQSDKSSMAAWLEVCTSSNEEPRPA